MSELIWHKVLDNKNELEEGRVRTVWAGHKGICLTYFQGVYSALDNACPHQGGPLGEGSIEGGLLRCPWHGWDYHPCSGKAPGFDDGVQTYEVKVEGDRIYVGLQPEKPHEETIADLMMKTMTNWGIDTVFGMVGHSNLGVADAMRREEENGNLSFFGVRHEGAASFAASAYGKLTGRPAACFAIAGPGATNMYTGMWDAKVDRAPLLALTGQVETQVVGTKNFQELDLVGAFQTVAEFNHRVLHDSKHAHLMSLAELEQSVLHYALKARAGKLTIDEMTGGTFTITNGGYWHSSWFGYCHYRSDIESTRSKRHPLRKTIRWVSPHDWLCRRSCTWFDHLVIALPYSLFIKRTRNRHANYRQLLAMVVAKLMDGCCAVLLLQYLSF